MKKKQFIGVCLLALLTITGCAQDSKETAGSKETNETTITSTIDTEVDSGASVAADGDVTTSASVVPETLVQPYTPTGFTKEEGKKRALFVIGDPRKYSVNYDLAYTAMKHFEDQGVEVEVRDLYDLNFNPVLSEETFYHAKDGEGEAPEDVAIEQAFIEQADHIVFVYPNWHDTPNAIVKGYMERVFSKQFAYKDSSDGLEGLLKEKSIYTIMNCGFLGGGRGFIGDGVGMNDELWDEYMNAFNVFDEDTAGFWGVTSKGRFVNDRTPKNNSENYESELNQLRTDLKTHLDKDFFTK